MPLLSRLLAITLSSFKLLLRGQASKPPLLSDPFAHRRAMGKAEGTLVAFPFFHWGAVTFRQIIGVGNVHWICRCSTLGDEHLKITVTKIPGANGSMSCCFV